MLKEAKKAMRVTVTDFDDEIMRECQAGLADLKIAGVIASGTVTFTESTSGAVTDTSTLSDPLIQMAIITYVRAHFGSPADADRLADSYEEQKGRLMHATGYTAYQDGESE